MSKVLILGGYGNFGKRIAFVLARSNIPVIIAGRNLEKAKELVLTIRAMNQGNQVESERVDSEHDFLGTLLRLKPRVVVNTCGPFQGKNYAVAQACIHAHVHYVDLADGRDFVTGINVLDERAKKSGVCVISGASTVPALSSAVLEHFRDDFLRIESLVYGISPGQKAERGLATTQGILSYVGNALKPVGHQKKPRYGWQDLYRQCYPELGVRWMANCDVPDLDLFPERFGIERICFSAGMENVLLHLGIWFASWLVRLKCPIKLEKHADFLLRVSHWFDGFGTADGGMHMIISGKAKNGQLLERRWFILGRDGDGPQIPCVPAIILARQLVAAHCFEPGAKACMGMITLDAYLEELKPFKIQTYSQLYSKK